jgi:hypothetical protein
MSKLHSLHRNNMRFSLCNSYEARIMCTTSTWDVRGMLLRQHVTHVWDAHFWRVCRVCVASIRVLQMSRTSSAYSVHGTMGSFWSVGLLYNVFATWRKGGDFCKHMGNSCGVHPLHTAAPSTAAPQLGLLLNEATEVKMAWVSWWCSVT